MKYALKVVQKNGDENYLREASGAIVGFPSYAAAYHQADFLKIGMEGDVQSINIVKYPKRAAWPPKKPSPTFATRTSRWNFSSIWRRMRTNSACQTEPA